MADVFDPEKRSEVMSRIRASGTKIESRLFAIVREAVGQRRRLVKNARSLPGRPDVYVPALSLTLFADGCFFHGCPKHGRIPDSNVSYWRLKLAANVARDARNRRELRNRGLSAWHVWEHDLEGKALERTAESLIRRIRSRQETLLPSVSYRYSESPAPELLRMAAESRVKYQTGN